MRTPLADAQRAFARALSDSDAPLPASIAGSSARDAARRFAIYRNNVTASLVDALADSYPVTAALVGEEFFRATARAYTVLHKPRSPILLYYGAEFPDFIDAFEPARELPYLADVARVEAAWTTAYHAADGQPCPVSALVALGERAADARAAFLPSVRVVRSRHPAGSIWLAHTDGGGRPPEDWAPETALMFRSDMTVTVEILKGAASAFVAALAARSTIAEAAAAALMEDENFDAGAALVALAQLGVFERFDLGEGQ